MIFPSPFNSTFIVAFCIAYLYGGTFATDEAAKQTNEQSLRKMAKSGNKLEVTSLLDSRVNVDAVDWSGRSALHYASDAGKGEVVTLLLSSRARVNLKDNIGQTPLHLAVQRGYIDIIIKLLAAKAKVDIQDRSGKTALDIAANQQVIKEILNRHKDLHDATIKCQQIITLLFKELQNAKADTSEAEKKANEAEKRVSEAEKSTSEAAKRATEAVKSTSEAVKRASEAEKRASEAEKRASEAVKRASETEKRVSEAEKRASEAVKRASETEKRVSEAEKRASEAEKRASDAEKCTSEAEKRNSEVEKRVSEAEKRVSEAEKSTSEAIKRATEAEKRATEAEKRASDTEKRVSEAEKRATGAEKRASDTEKRASEAVKRDSETEKRANEAEKRATEENAFLIICSSVLVLLAVFYCSWRCLKINGTIGAERRAVVTEVRATEAEERATEAEERATEVERRAIEDEKRATEAQIRATEANKRALEAENATTAGVPSWTIKRKEICLLDKVLGRGGWCVVKAARFRGIEVAAKLLHDIIVSPYNLQLFKREMDIAAVTHHPNILLFIGATLDEEYIILSELMPFSLRGVLETRKLSNQQVISISTDVCRALNYLHSMKPVPIVHRDVSSANVLLEPVGVDTWRAKLSDYGSANFVRQMSTVAPGSSVYAAPESVIPSQQSPKMDTFSYGVLLLEMMTGEFPDVQKRENLLQSLSSQTMATIIRECTSKDPNRRPDMADILLKLTEICTM